MGYVESGKQDGAKVLVGEERRAGNGYFADPAGKAACASFVNRDLPEMLTHLGKSSPMFNKT